MKRIILIQSLILIIFFSFASNISAQVQKKEVFIIGTMHQVPKYLKRSYKPLYKMALKYNPEAIYVEVSRAEDTLSMQNYFPKFLEYSDSLKTVFDYSEAKFNELMNTSFNQLEKEDFRYLAKSFALKRDYANYKYYIHLFSFGKEGSKKPIRNEDGDLSYKLAAKLNMKYVYAMDNQKFNPEYHKAWENCSIEGRNNGNNEIVSKLSKKIFKSAIIPSIFGRHGRWANNIKTLNRFHNLNSFRYDINDCDSCKDGMKYWDNRNQGMAINIGGQIQENNHQKNLVVVGAGHVVGLKEELEKLYPNIIVKIIHDKSYKKDSTIQAEDTLISQK